ncbi:hypothetical protein [Rhodoferax antarcticus]|uniref:hypothetical protein n=1 Tax=Rhodoferax antarcticus TaxID=81479 RepID=UPI00094FDD8F|nr:hypothetical protein [Rhodoferax antarcticus]
MTKYAGYIGNGHITIRTTPFFDSADAVIGKFDYVQKCGNWQEHMKWNAERVGMYATAPVTE